MLLLFETSAGHALFEMKKAAELEAMKSSDLWDALSTKEKLASRVKLKAFSAFKDTSEAVVAATESVQSKLGKALKRFLNKHVAKKDLKLELGVADTKLGSAIKEKLGIKVVHSKLVEEALRGVRQLVAESGGEVLKGVEAADYRAMQLGLSHSLSRYKLKFSPDKVDTMVIQAVGLLDDLDKEVNTYAMRCREWYGWHFPEMAKILNDNLHYAKVVKLVGFRSEFRKVQLEELAECIDDDESVAKSLMETAEISMGTEVDKDDMEHIITLADQVVDLSEFRTTLAQYLRSRMQAIAPNLTSLVGELVGARMVQHAGSIMNLAKHPASTVQILGAEKALFRALKTKHDTPKYGLIYHASLIGQASPKNKGKISRVLAAKCSLASRVDALGEADGPTVGPEMRAKVEARLRHLEGGKLALPGTSSAKKRPLVEVLADDAADAAPAYSVASDLQALPAADGDTTNRSDEPATNGTNRPPVKKKQKKKSTEGDEKVGSPATGTPKPKKRKAPSQTTAGDDTKEEDAAVSEKKKKKKKKDAPAVTKD